MPVATPRPMHGPAAIGFGIGPRRKLRVSRTFCEVPEYQKKFFGLCAPIARGKKDRGEPAFFPRRRDGIRTKNPTSRWDSWSTAGPKQSKAPSRNELCDPSLELARNDVNSRIWTGLPKERKTAASSSGHRAARVAAMTADGVPGSTAIVGCRPRKLCGQTMGTSGRCAARSASDTRSSATCHHAPPAAPGLSLLALWSVIAGCGDTLSSVEPRDPSAAEVTCPTPGSCPYTRLASRHQG